MEMLFLKLADMSLTASWLVLAIAAVRLIFRRMPKRTVCLLWVMVGLRLICPWSMESPLSLIPSIAPLSARYFETQAPTKAELAGQMAQSALTPAVQGGGAPVLLWVLSWIWVMGVAAMLVYALASYLVLRRRVATAVLVRQNIKRCEFIDSAFVLGLVMPVIYLPTSLEKGDWDSVIAHEQAHIQRRDPWWKFLGFLLLSVYWFNPIMWLAYTLLCRDIEAACDEQVIRGMDRDALRRYSKALLQSGVRRPRAAVCPLAFGEVGLRERIQAVMGYRKPGFLMAAVSAGLTLLIAIAFLTDPSREYDPNAVYPQAVLRDPDYVVVDVSGEDRVYEPDSPAYKSIVAEIRKNWWKYTPQGLDTATDAELSAPLAPELLKTNSWRTYVEMDDTIVCFRYDSSPVVWKNGDGEETAIQTIAFVLPEKTWSQDNTKGFFLLCQTEHIGINEGLYTYYYPPALANDFWGFVIEASR